VETTEPSRPITDFFVDLFNLDPDGTLAAVISSIVEPLVQIVIVLGIAWFLLVVMRRIARFFMDRAKDGLPTSIYGASSGVDRRNQRVEALGSLLISLLGFAVWVAAFLFILGRTFGINLTPFLAGAGVAGIAIAFGAQDLVKDFVSGVFMLIEDQFGVGDVIDVGQATGTVEKVSLRTTRLRDVNGTVWHFPNGEIRGLGNLSQEWSRVLLDVTVGYGSDINQASEVIRSVAADMVEEEEYRSLILAPPEVWGVENLGPDGVALRLVIKTRPGEQAAISRELRRRIKEGLESAGVELPLSQRAVWVRGDPAPGQSADG
jgi:small conductance mechanosensitive channel